MQIYSQEPNTTQIRNTLRQTFRERRRRLSKAEHKAAGEHLVNNIIEHNLLHENMRVAIYKTNDSELTTEPLINYCWKRSIEVFLPVLHPFADGHLLFLKYVSDSPMKANLYGILEPKLDIRLINPIDKFDVIFTPLVAFDEHGNRLGMGGGFYDRTLAPIIDKPSRSPRIIGIAHDIQKTISLPAESWDLPLPTIITPTNFYNFNE